MENVEVKVGDRVRFIGSNHEGFNCYYATKVCEQGEEYTVDTVNIDTFKLVEDTFKYNLNKSQFVVINPKDCIVIGSSTLLEAFVKECDVQCSSVCFISPALVFIWGDSYGAASYDYKIADTIGDDSVFSLPEDWYRATAFIKNNKRPSYVVGDVVVIIANTSLSCNPIGTVGVVVDGNNNAVKVEAGLGSNNWHQVTDVRRAIIS